MHNARLIPVGSTIERAYYVVPGQYGSGTGFDNWDDAVRAARAKYDALVTSLVRSMAGYASEAEIARTASIQTVIDLRLVIRHPAGSGPVTSTDTVAERFENVAALRTSDEIGARS